MYPSHVLMLKACSVFNNIYTAIQVVIVDSECQLTD